MKHLTKEQVEKSFQILKEIERKDLNQKLMVIRFYYLCFIVSILIVCGMIIYKEFYG